MKLVRASLNSGADQQSYSDTYRDKCKKKIFYQRKETITNTVSDCTSERQPLIVERGQCFDAIEYPRHLVTNLC